VDLGTVVGSGPDGTVTRADVEAAVAFQRLADEPRQGRIVNDHSTFQRESRQDTFPPGGGYGPFGAGSGVGAGGGAQPGPFNGRQERRVPIRGVRKATAENLVRSVNTHVHVTEWITIDVTPTMDFVEKLKNRREFTGLRISPLLVYAKAICLALARHPDLDTAWSA